MANAAVGVHISGCYPCKFYEGFRVFQEGESEKLQPLDVDRVFLVDHIADHLVGTRDLLEPLTALPQELPRDRADLVSTQEPDEAYVLISRGHPKHRHWSTFILDGVAGERRTEAHFQGGKGGYPVGFQFFPISESQMI